MVLALFATICQLTRRSGETLKLETVSIIFLFQGFRQKFGAKWRAERERKKGHFFWFTSLALSPLSECLLPHGTGQIVVFFYYAKNIAYAGAHKPERTTPMLGLCHSVFTDQFIFRHILRHFFSRKQTLHHVYEHIRSIKYQKGKLNVIKRQKISFLGLQVLLTGLWNLKDIQNSRQNRSKNKLVRENAVTCTEVALSGLWAPGYVVVIPEHQHRNVF